MSVPGWFVGRSANATKKIEQSPLLFATQVSQHARRMEVAAHRIPQVDAFVGERELTTQRINALRGRGRLCQAMLSNTRPSYGKSISNVASQIETVVRRLAVGQAMSSVRPPRVSLSRSRERTSICSTAPRLSDEDSPRRRSSH